MNSKDEIISGEMLYSDGSLYTGYFVDDYKSGLGKLVLASKEVFKGNFLDD